MPTREKLIEKINTKLMALPYGEITLHTAEEIADSLIEEGYVTDTNVGKWISVKDGLPKESGDYLAYCGNGYIGLMPYSTQYKLFNTFDGCGTKHAIAVTHWMPLPQPPEGV